jgi:putative nucleotidyltransferase with HDIG domain
MRILETALAQGFVRKAPREEPVPASPSAKQDEQRSWLARRTLDALVAIVATGGIGLTVYALATADVSGPDWALLIALVCLAVVAERTDLSMYGASRVSLAFIPIFAAVVASGTLGLALVVPPAVIASAWGRPLHKTLFNFGTLMLAGLAANGVLDSFTTANYQRDWPEVMLPATLAGGANFVVNSSLVAAAIGLSTKASLRRVWSDNFMWLLPHYIILAFIAIAIVAAYDAMGIWGVIVFLAPPVMMRLSIKQYLDKTTKSVLDLRRAHIQLQHAHDQVTAAMTSLGKAYDGTLRSLSNALDLRDSETGGHSERVADLTMAIAGELGIQRDSEHWRYISWGALLHDVGKIAIPDQILRKPGKLDEQEWQIMRTHSRAGNDILNAVDFLVPVAEMVYSHHERYDGTGYPRGLAAEEIPLGARIFMIADAFDAMTSDRVYRRAMPAEEALAEILRNSGTQFDPGCVRAFLSVYQKRFVGTVHHRHFVGSMQGRSSGTELSESLKKAIAEAAGLETGH